MRSVWLCSRNDAISNIAVMAEAREWFVLSGLTGEKPCPTQKP